MHADMMVWFMCVTCVEIRAHGLGSQGCKRGSAHTPGSFGWQVAKKAGPATPKPAKRKAADDGEGGKAKRARAADPRSASEPKKEVRRACGRRRMLGCA